MNVVWVQIYLELFRYYAKNGGSRNLGQRKDIDSATFMSDAKSNFFCIISMLHSTVFDIAELRILCKV